MGWRRFGGMISPFVAGLLLSADNNITLVWCMMSAFQLASAIVTFVLAWRHADAISNWYPNPPDCLAPQCVTLDRAR